MSDERFNAALYREANEAEFSKIDFQCDEFPVIFGNVMVAMFADSGALRIGKGVTINSAIWANPVGGTQTCFLFKGDEAIIEIGDGTGMSNVMLAARTRITIGKNVSLGAGMKVFDTDFHSIDLAERKADINIPTKPVTIEDGAFIGGDAIILKGVTIGENSVIGAGSVVPKSVPAGEIWGGNPAKFIKKL